MLLYQAKLFLFSSEITQLRKIDYQLIVRKEKIKAVAAVLVVVEELLANLNAVQLLVLLVEDQQQNRIFFYFC